jgi:hypothetical protein
LHIYGVYIQKSEYVKRTFSTVLEHRFSKPKALGAKHLRIKTLISPINLGANASPFFDLCLHCGLKNFNKLVAKAKFALLGKKVKEKWEKSYLTPSPLTFPLTFARSLIFYIGLSQTAILRSTNIRYMPAIANSQSIRQSLQQVLQSTKEGKTQLPDFQRSWVWHNEQISSLLASVSLSYPIGAVMMLETGNPAVRFKHRLLEGVALSPPPKPEQLILDGQQRITSLFQVLLSGKPVVTKDGRGKEIHRWYYIDITKALDRANASPLQPNIDFCKKSIVKIGLNTFCEYTEPETNPKLDAADEDKK